MNKSLKIILLGLLIWVIPFIVTLFVWDFEANISNVSLIWFNAILAFAWAVGFAIAVFIYFKSKIKDPRKEGLVAGISWYIILLIMDLVVLVGAFGMDLAGYFTMLVTYLGTLILPGVIGEILTKR